MLGIIRHSRHLVLLHDPARFFPIFPFLFRALDSRRAVLYLSLRWCRLRLCTRCTVPSSSARSSVASVVVQALDLLVPPAPVLRLAPNGLTLCRLPRRTRERRVFVAMSTVDV